MNLPIYDIVLKRDPTAEHGHDRFHGAASSEPRHGSERGRPRLRVRIRFQRNSRTRASALLAILVLGLVSASRVEAQTFTILHHFTATNGVAGTNSGGAVPRAGIMVAGDTLYGATVFGGSSGHGTLFKIGTDGTGFTTLHTFAGASDGAAPRAPLLLIGGTLYGASSRGGSSGNGTIFRINTDGTSFSNLYNFTATEPNTGTNSDGAQPNGSLILWSNTLYGTANVGGSSGSGTVFKIGTNGIGFSTLHHFTGNDGNEPIAGLILSSNTLYGTTFVGGTSGNGTLFAINTDGTSFTNLYHFSASAGIFSPNSDGTAPIGSLTLSGNTLYGAAAGGGATGNGTVFRVNTDGSGFTNLYSFSAVPDPDNPPYLNADGSTPVSGLILVGNTLYGTAEVGGSSAAGTLFSINTDGTGFTNLHTFTTGEGANPIGSLVLSGNTLCGTASSYYADSINLTDYGTVFSLSFAPQLTITPSGPNVVVSWPTSNGGFSYAGYFLQSTVDLGPAAGWITFNLPAPPIVVDGHYVVTLPNSVGSRHFFRLSQ